MKTTKRNTIELYSEWMFQDLKDAGYLKDWIREPETLIVAEKLNILKNKYYKTKPTGMENMALFPKIRYTYDYKLIWNEHAKYLFFEDIGQVPLQHGKPMFYAFKSKSGYVTLLDVKPPSVIASRFGGVNTSVTFPLKQRMLYQDKGIYIQKFIPIPMAGTGKTTAMFPKYFTPKRYLLTDGGRQARKIRFVITDLNGYLYKKNLEIDHNNKLLK